MAKENKQGNKSDITFTNVLAVVDHLKTHDWKLEKSLAYIHKKEGKLRPRKDGLFHLKDIEKYAVTFLNRIDGSTGSDLDQYQNEKSKTELEISQEKRDFLRRKNQLAAGMYVPREAFEQELAKRAAVFKSDVENFIRGGAEKTIALVGGDPAKAPALIEHQLDAAADWLNRYDSDQEFKVPAPAVMAAALTDEDFGDEGDSNG